MIIREINIFNLGVYKGQHSINIEPKKNKPVILFGALNGAGKTTLLEGIQIALYGKSAKTNGRGNKSYEDYLKGLINRDTPEKYGASIEIIFTVNINSKPSEIKITRSWKAVGSKIKEFCNIVQDGLIDSDASDRASEFIEEIIPSEISNLFFFDGEMIDGYSQPEQSKFLIQKGIYTLLGINTINNLSKSLSIVERRKAKTLSNDDQKISIEKEESELKMHNQKRQQLLQTQAALRNDLDILENDISKHRELLKQQGYDLFNQRELIKQNILNTSSQRELINEQLINLSQEFFPLIVIEEQINKLRKKVKQTEGHSNESLALLTSEFQMMQEYGGLKKIDQEPITKYINDRIQKIESTLGEYSYNIDESLIPTNEEIHSEKVKISDLIKKLESTELELEKLEKKINAVPDEEKIKPLIEKDLMLQKNQNQIEAKINLIESELDQLLKHIEYIEKEINIKLEKINAMTIGNLLDKKVIEKSLKVRDTLEKFKASLIDKHIHSISNEISDCFKSLSRKKMLNLEFKIDPNDFSLTVFKKVGLKLESYISPKSWAAGEKQILGISILWALTRVAKMNFPIVIDTPLSRLDNTHRETVIKNYFPKASEQVLVFSTDTEINDRLLKKIQPDVSYEYLIQYDGSSNSSSFSKGYFNNKKVSL